MDDDAPQVRIGDSERDAVLDSLKAHFAAGRLDVDELEERTAAALAARTRGDLVLLTADLPLVSIAVPAGEVCARDALRLHRRLAVVVAALFVVLWVVTLGKVSPIPGAAIAALSVAVHWVWRRWQERR